MNLTSFNTLEHQLNKFYELSGIPLCLCDTKGTALFIISPESGMAPSKDYLSSFIKAFHCGNHSIEKPLIWTTRIHSLIGLIQLGQNQYLMVGPTLSSKLTHKEIRDTYSNIIPENLLLLLCKSLTKTPVYTHHKFLCALSLLIELCTGKHVSFEDIALVNPSAPSDKENASLSAPFPDFDNSVYYADILSYEHDICNAVAAGNPSVLKELFMQPVHMSVDPVSKVPLTREKYSFIVLTALVNRAAVQGGMPVEAAFSLGNSYLQKIEFAASLNEIEILTYKMIRDFCNRVKNTKPTGEYSPIIRKCQNYICEHLHEKISLNDLARHCGVSSRSISSHFSRKLGMSVPQYITREKLKESQYLLVHTNYSISEISYHLQFSSQSYFTRVFREAFGCTPQQYRYEGIFVLSEKNEM